MFKTFREYIQTHEGHTAPLDSPVSSCCLLALITFPHFDNWGIAGLVVTAIATTGLVVGLGVMLVVRMANPQRKNLNLKHQIPQLIMLKSKQLKENLERSLFLSLSDSAIKESFYREIAIKINVPIRDIKEEIFFNDTKICHFLLTRKDLTTNETAEEFFETDLKYWQSLNYLVSTTIPLISPEITLALKQYIQQYIEYHNKEDNYQQFKEEFYQLIKNNLNLESKTVEYYFLIEEVLITCYQISNQINNQKDLSQYEWHNYTNKEKVELWRQAIVLFEENLKEELKTNQNYNNILDIINFLEQLPPDQQTQASIFNKFNQQKEKKNQGTKSIVSNKQLAKSQQDDWNQEEQITYFQQFKPSFLPKDGRTSEETQEFSRTSFYLQLQERLIELLIINEPTQEQKDEIEQLKQSLDPILVEHIKKNLDSLQYLKKQKALFQQSLPEIRKNFQGFYVFFENGEVKDSDFDEEALMERVLDNNPQRKSALIKKVI